MSPLGRSLLFQVCFWIKQLRKQEAQRCTRNTALVRFRIMFVLDVATNDCVYIVAPVGVAHPPGLRISKSDEEWFIFQNKMPLPSMSKIKTHDYALDWRPRILDSRVPELWFTAVDDLIQHDHYIRVHPPRADDYRLPGKKLYHLLHCGWVTSREASHNWRREDWQAVTDYEDRLTGPYPVRIPKSVKKPSHEERAALRVTRYNPMDETIPEDKIFSSSGPGAFPAVIEGLPRPVNKRLLVSATLN